jgi:hypothetical protein
MVTMLSATIWETAITTSTLLRVFCLRLWLCSNICSWLLTLLSLWLVLFISRALLLAFL